MIEPFSCVIDASVGVKFSRKRHALLINDAFLVVNVPMSGLQRKNLTAAFGARARLGAGARAHITSTKEPDARKTPKSRFEDVRCISAPGLRATRAFTENL